MPDYFYQITDLNNNVKGEIRDKALTDLETAANAGKFIQISGNQTLTAALPATSFYGTSSSALLDNPKVSSINNFTLTTGTIVSINFTNANTYQAGALNLNISNTGVKPVYYNGLITSAANRLYWDAGETLSFIYTGSNYCYIGRSGKNYLGKLRLVKYGDTSPEVANIVDESWYNGNPVIAYNASGKTAILYKNDQTQKLEFFTINQWGSNQINFEKWVYDYNGTGTWSTSTVTLSGDVIRVWEDQ